ncbi:MAG: acetylglutamate kinase [Thermoflexaceae bacterium]|nr:acetylglutamate kinase [Thermoflexaceae bacterium]
MTDEKVLPVVVAVFAGLVNKRIVAAINAAGFRAVGFSGADGRLLECRLAPPEFGFVGEPEAVHPEAVIALREAGIIPVVSPIGYVPGSPADQLVNVNADTVAGSIAAAIGAEGVVFLTDVEGVRGPTGTVIPELDMATARAYIADGTIAGGMILEGGGLPPCRVAGRARDHSRWPCAPRVARKRQIGDPNHGVMATCQRC